VILCDNYHYDYDYQYNTDVIIIIIMIMVTQNRVWLKWVATRCRDPGHPF